MAMKGHKPGCQCVGCSAATRKRGMKALKRSAGDPAKPKKPRRTKKPKTNAAPAAPAAAAPKKKRRKKKANAAPAAAAKSKTTVRHPTLPDGIKDGYLVLVAAKGRGVSSIRHFGRLADAQAFIQTLNGSVAALCDVRAIYRAAA